MHNHSIKGGKVRALTPPSFVKAKLCPSLYNHTHCEAPPAAEGALDCSHKWSVTVI